VADDRHAEATIRAPDAMCHVCALYWLLTGQALKQQRLI
jgi:hypothetical protein